MFKVAVAHSLELDSAEAVADVLGQCRRQLADLTPQAGLLFTGIDHDFPVILKKIKSAYPEMELIGGTTDGEISSVHGYADDSIVLMAFCSDEVAFKTGIIENVFEDTIHTTKKGIESALSQSGIDPELCIVIPSGVGPSRSLLNGDTILEGFKSILGEKFPVLGGAAGDQFSLEGTYQFYNDRVFTNALPFLLIAGPLLYSFGVEAGWLPIGPKERITKSDKNTVHQIGSETALQFYKHYLGEDIGIHNPIIISQYPLAVFEGEDAESYYIRAGTVADQDLENGALTVSAYRRLFHKPARLPF